MPDYNVKQRGKTCPRCGFEAPTQHFGKLNNEDQLHCLDVLRCPECGHIFAPVPDALMGEYLTKVLRVQPL